MHAGDRQSSSDLKSKEGSAKSDRGAESAINSVCSEVLINQIGNMSIAQGNNDSAAVGGAPKSKAQLRAERRAVQVIICHKCLCSV
jgi:hypothetical protein